MIPQSTRRTEFPKPKHKMTTRLKASKTGLRTRAEFDQALDEIAELQVALRTHEAKRDKGLQAVRDEHAPKIDELKERLSAKFLLAEKYAEQHRAEIFPTAKKSGDTGLSLFGFRLGNPTLKTLNKRWTWDSVLAAVKSAFGGKRFVRVKEELDKDALKSELSDEQLATVGCRVEQAEEFFVEAKDQPTQSAA